MEAPAKITRTVQITLSGRQALESSSSSGSATTSFRVSSRARQEGRRMSSSFVTASNALRNPIRICDRVFQVRFSDFEQPQRVASRAVSNCWRNVVQIATCHSAHWRVFCPLPFMRQNHHTADSEANKTVEKKLVRIGTGPPTRNVQFRVLAVFFLSAIVYAAKPPHGRQ